MLSVCLIVFIYIAIGMKWYARVQKFCFFGGLLGLAIVFGLLLFGNNQTFVANYNAMAPNFGATAGDVYSATMQAGQEAGTVASSLFPLAIGASIFLVPMLTFFNLWPNWGSTLYGEVRGASDYKRNFWGMAAAIIVTTLGALLLFALIAKSIGWDFYNKANGAFWNYTFGYVTNTPPLPIWPYPALFAAFMVKSRVVQFIIVNDGSGLTGGSFGLDTVEGLFPSLGPQAQIKAYYWTVLLVIVVATYAVARIRASRLGIALQTVRDAPAYAAARGVNPLKYRVFAFAISGFIAGLAGALYVSFNQSITPSVMGLTPMSIDVTMLVIGGLGTIAGPAIGTGMLTVIQTSLVDYPGIQLTILGTILLVIVVFVPGGIVGLVARIKTRVARWVAEEEAPDRLPPEEPRTHAVTFDMPDEQPPESTYPNV
jgi:branched-subunit amino acid ABC-type transport system permease component